MVAYSGPTQVENLFFPLLLCVPSRSCASAHSGESPGSERAHAVTHVVAVLERAPVGCYRRWQSRSIVSAIQHRRPLRPYHHHSNRSNLNYPGRTEPY